MLIFPEGTRSKGRGLLPFRSGAVKLAVNSLAPIVPIAVLGSYEVFEKDYRLHAVPVRMVFLPPVETASMSADERRHKLAEQVRGQIEGELVKQ
jgi:1-acyl-sn-glycerol-3-phosphate acyltransferase